VYSYIAKPFFMKTSLQIFILLLLTTIAMAQQGMVKGKIYGDSQHPIADVTVRLNDKGLATSSDSLGNFIITDVAQGSYTLTLSKIGYETVSRKIHISSSATLTTNIILKENYLNLKEVYIKSTGVNISNTIDKIDLQLRPVNSSQDLLRLVPGLFIAQHAGGGKAEQLFLRGFDIDHGTDFAIYVDGMPVNMTSHAHGQGYADLHFLIPETVKELEVNKGPYNTRYGDLATAGAGEFRTLNSLDQNQIKLEYGMFNTQRALVMLNLLDKKHILSTRKENLYIAGEYKYTDAYFRSKQHFSRMNFFTKYSALMNNGSQLVVNASTFHSNWDASGQVPERKVNDGTISSFGSIDDTEGGKTSRSNVTLIHTQPLKKGTFKNQVYYSKYDFNLYSNFTFFLNDSINGDQIRQVDDRNIIGYTSTLNLQHIVGNKSLGSSIAAGVRYDNSEISLTHTVKRQFLNDVVKGKLNQVNAWTYIDENLDITSKLRVNGGVRLDIFNFDFQNQTDVSSSGNTTKARVSPKLNFIYTMNKNVQLFAKSGFGFHSNDARAVVVGKLANTLPRATGYEVGSTFKPADKLVMNVALWALHLQSELIYVGDEGVVEASGRTHRIGIDLGARYQFAKHWFLDADLNYNKGRLVDEPSDANRIPLAPVVTSIGGISYKTASGLNFSLRYRYMGDRAANEDYSLTASGYLLADAVVNYTIRKFQFGISAENLLNKKWKEAQFATESRLPNEPQSVEEIHFTPGTPFFLKASIGFYF